MTLGVTWLAGVGGLQGPGAGCAWCCGCFAWVVEGAVQQLADSFLLSDGL